MIHKSLSFINYSFISDALNFSFIGLALCWRVRHKIIIYANNDEGTVVVYVIQVLLCLVRALALMLEDAGLFRKFTS